MSDAPRNDRPRDRESGPDRVGSRFSFRTRLMIGLVAAAVLPVTGFGLVLAVSDIAGRMDPTVSRLLLFAIAVAAMLGVLLAYLLTADLLQPLRALARAVERTATGELVEPLEVVGEDELARLAESHNRLAADLERRNRELGRILVAIGELSPREGVARLADKAAADAKAAFAMIDAAIHLGDPSEIPLAEDVPGDPRPIRAILSLPDERLGVLYGRLPATRSWERADQDLLELFASEIAVAVRNAELFETVEAQTARLIELADAKDDFLRGISHNLQTPLTSIRAHAEQMTADRPDRRLGIIAEQSERLSRMVRQLLTVSRIESGALRPQAEVLALGPRVRRAWEALAAEGVPFTLSDDSWGWLAVADPDHVDQVLWALLDNAVKYGGGSPVSVALARDEAARRLRLTVADEGPGVANEDRARLFGRFERAAVGGSGANSQAGTGLGLYVSRELCRAMDGDLVLEPSGIRPIGAALTVILPGEPPEES